ncbi:MAG: hypothetical protein AAGI08_08785 [Bacteroidota bacterium]
MRLLFLAAVLMLPACDLLGIHTGESRSVIVASGIANTIEKSINESGNVVVKIDSFASPCSHVGRTDVQTIGSIVILHPFDEEEARVCRDELIFLTRVVVLDADVTIEDVVLVRGVEHFSGDKVIVEVPKAS